MSITMSMTTFRPTDPLTWKQADADVHVATRSGEFAGFVEFDGTAHLVRDQHGTDLGSFDSLDGARLALEHAGRSVRRPLSFPFRIPKALRRVQGRARS
jgi:hypothetical protein